MLRYALAAVVVIGCSKSGPVEPPPPTAPTTPAKPDCRHALEDVAMLFELVGTSARSSPSLSSSIRSSVFEDLSPLATGTPVDLSSRNVVVVGDEQVQAAVLRGEGSRGPFVLLNPHGGGIPEGPEIVLLPMKTATIGAMHAAIREYRAIDGVRISVGYLLPGPLAGRPRPASVARGSGNIAALFADVDKEIAVHCPGLADSHTAIDDPRRLVDFAPKVRGCACETDADLIAAIPWTLARRPITTVPLLGKGTTPWPASWHTSGSEGYTADEKVAEAQIFAPLTTDGKPTPLSLPPDLPPPPPPPPRRPKQ